MSFTVYILSDLKDNLYVGQTQDFCVRLQQHKAGKSRTTKSYSTHVPVHTFEVASRYLALKIESYLQHVQRKFGNFELLNLLHDCPFMSAAIWTDALARPDTEFQLKFKSHQN